MGPLRPNRRLILAALVLAGAVLLVTSPVFVLAMAPAIALFALVAHRVMPGEDLIVRLRSAPRARRRVAPHATPLRRARPAPLRPPDRVGARRAPAARGAAPHHQLAARGSTAHGSRPRAGSDPSIREDPSMLHHKLVLLAATGAVSLAAAAPAFAHTEVKSTSPVEGQDREHVHPHRHRHVHAADPAAAR